MTDKEPKLSPNFNWDKFTWQEGDIIITPPSDVEKKEKPKEEKPAGN